MGGKPAARQGDMTRKGLDIVQGSAGVLIGAPTGVACSVCPGGITYANPVNPLLGAKVLPGETDLIKKPRVNARGFFSSVYLLLPESQKSSAFYALFPQQSEAHNHLS